MNEIDREARPSEMPSCRDCGEPVDQTSLFRRPSEIPNDCHWMCWEANADRRSLTAQLAALRDENAGLRKTVEDFKRLGMWTCSSCGPHVRSRANWCERGCGSDYNRMEWVAEGQTVAALRDERDRAVKQNEVLAQAIVKVREWVRNNRSHELKPLLDITNPALIESEEG